MDPHGKINRVRKKVLRTLTGWIAPTEKRSPGPIDAATVKRVLICRPNGRLGNQLMVTPLIQELNRLFPDCKIDLFVKGWVASRIFTNYDCVDRIISLPGRPFKQLPAYLSVWAKLVGRRYDLTINASRGSSSGRISTALSRSKNKLFCVPNQELMLTRSGYRHMARYPVYNLREYLGTNYSKEQLCVPTMDLRLNEQEKSRGARMLRELTGNDKPTIGIYTYATGAKRYSPQWWKQTHAELVATYGDSYNIIEMLPIENVSQIDFAAPSLYSKDIREMAAVISQFSLFVTSDCGVMHLASSVNVPVVSLFCVTDIAVYEPYNEKSAAIDTNTEDGRVRIMELTKWILPNKTIPSAGKYNYATIFPDHRRVGL